MTPQQFNTNRKTVQTPSGTISYVEYGKGPVALFVHGVLLSLNEAMQRGGVTSPPELSFVQGGAWEA
jgi:hypothetical protein